MISTLHGKLPLILAPVPQLPITPAGRVEICGVRGEALGQHLNVQVSLDIHSGELLLFSPDGYVGSFRLGDLVAAHVSQCVALAVAERREGEHAQAH